MVPSDKVPSFGGLMLSPGPLIYRNGNFELLSKWNESNSYNSTYGVRNGSTYFLFTDIGKNFDSRGSSFSYRSGDINNSRTLSFGGFDDWRIPSALEGQLITGFDYGLVEPVRSGSKVNGNSNKHFAMIQTTITFAGARNVKGALIFPDNCSITGKAITYFDTISSHNTGFSSSDIDVYLSQGAIFVPRAGVYNSGWKQSNEGYYIETTTSTYDSNGTFAETFHILDSDFGGYYARDKRYIHCPVLFIRNV